MVRRDTVGGELQPWLRQDEKHRRQSLVDSLLPVALGYRIQKEHRLPEGQYQIQDQIIH
jgi:hypothetical protein